MSKNLDESGKLPKVILLFKEASPLKTLIILVISIFLAEMVAMVILYFLDLRNYWVETFLDGVIMILLISPGLYLLQLKPLLDQIQERNRVGHALRFSEDLLSRVIKSMPVGVWITDKDGKITAGNLASQKIWNGARYVGIDAYGEYKGWWRGTGKRIEAAEWAGAKAVTRGETILDEEVDIEAFDGERKVILNSAVPILDEQQVIQGAIIVNQDITRIKQAEKTLLQANDLLEKFFESVHTMFVYLDRDFNFIRVNKAYALASGHPVEFFVGKNHFDLYPDQENEAIFQRVVDTGQPYTVLEKPFEYAEYPERGVTYWDWSLLPVKDANNLVEGLVFNLNDVTVRKRAELRLAQQNQELRLLSDSENRQRIIAEGLLRAIISINTTLELDLVLRSILENIRALIPFQGANILLLEGNSLRVAGYLGYEAFPGSIPAVGEVYALADYPSIQQITSTRQPLILNSVDQDPGWIKVPGLEWIRSYLAVPMVLGDQAVGAINLVSEFPDAFRQQSIDQLQDFAPSAMLAINNAMLFKQLDANRQRMQSLARQLVETQEKERANIARELHDESGQVLSYLMLSLSRLEQSPDCTPFIATRLQDMKAVVNRVLEDLHRLALSLRPSTLNHLGLVAALEQYTSSLSSERLVVKFKAVGFDPARLPGDIETALYRIVHEAMSNVIKHAQASNVGILLERGQGRIKVFVEDDGIGMTSDIIEQKNRMGIVGMRERAEMLGGNLTIESTPGKGTTIIVEVPDGN